MSILLLGPMEVQRISDAVSFARAHVIPWSFIQEAVVDDRDEPTDELLLKDRKPGFERPESQHVLLGSYRAAISFEEQPAGIMRHLSVSSYGSGIPGYEVMRLICEAFGFSRDVSALIGGDMLAMPKRPFRVWLEEFEPHCMAVNVLEVEA